MFDDNIKFLHLVLLQIKPSYTNEFIFYICKCVLFFDDDAASMCIYDILIHSVRITAERVAHLYIRIVDRLLFTLKNELKHVAHFKLNATFC